MKCTKCTNQRHLNFDKDCITFCTKLGMSVKNTTRRLGNVRLHLMFRPRSFAIQLNGQPNEEEIENSKKSHKFDKLLNPK